MDRIANLIITLKNANAVGKEKVFVPATKIISEIAELLKTEGYVKAVKLREREGSVQKFLEIVLSYTEDKQPKIREVERVSKSSSRVYIGVKDIRPYKQGTGLTVLTTPKGIMTDKQARKAHVGGEVLFSIF